MITFKHRLEYLSEIEEILAEYDIAEYMYKIF